MSLLLIQATSLHLPLADHAVHCIVTSPPYFHLRDYGTPEQLGLESLHDCLGWATGASCGACYLCRLRTVFAACWRVLRDDGTLFIVIGDSYNAAGRTGRGTLQGYTQGTNRTSRTGADPGRATAPGLKPKDLCGIPQRLALALQADGWTWRSELIWDKPNPMVEAVRDRPTKAHEQILLFSKRPRYFWDAFALDEPTTTRPKSSWEEPRAAGETMKRGMNQLGVGGPEAATTRNVRTVWRIPTAPTSVAHFATMPTALATRCLKAGTSSQGVCQHCGTPWIRQVTAVRRLDGATVRTDQGFRPGCACADPAPVPAIVCDPFVGSGTVPLVARALGRHGVGVDLSWPYLQIARERCGLTALSAWLGTPGTPCESPPLTDLPLFGSVQT